MNPKFSLASALGVALSLSACPSTLDQPAATDLVLDTLNLDEDSDDVIVFSYPDPLTPDNDLRPYDLGAHFRGAPESPEPDQPAAPAAVEITEESWFFWVDDAPGARFVHPNRFVLVPVAGGDPVVVEQQWWPVLEGVGLWTDTDAYWDPANHVLATATRPDPPVDEARGEDEAREGDVPPGGGRKVALVVNGWEEDESGGDDMEVDGNGMHDFLTDVAGFEVTYLGPTQDANPDRDGENTREARYAFFEAAAQDLGPGDTLVVYITSHGNWYEDPDEPDELWKTGPHDYYGGIAEWELIHHLEDINPSATIIVSLDSCYAGAIHDGMECVADMTITATGYLDPAYSDLDSGDTNPDDAGGEFTSSWLGALIPLYDPSQAEAICEAADAAGQSFDERAFGQAFADGYANDAAAQAGKSSPFVSHGAPEKVKPEVPKVTECEDPPPPGDVPECDPPVEPDPMEAFANLFADMLGANTVTGEFVCDAQGDTNDLSDLIHQTEATLWWDHRVYGATTIEVDLSTLEGSAWSEDACGEQALCPSIAGATPEGEYVVLAAVHDAPLPSTELEFDSTWAAVCASNDDPTDDWVPHPAFPGDFWAGSEFWLVVNQPAGGLPEFSVLDASSGTAEAVASGARAFIQDGTLLFAVPRVEFEAEEQTSCRFSAFGHDGGYGLDGGFWNGDITPTIEEPMITIELGPRPEVPVPEGASGTVPCDSSTFDFFEVTPPSTGTLSITVDTVSAETTFDPYAWVTLDSSGNLSEAEATGDDNMDCTFPPPNYSCPQFTYEVEAGVPAYVGIVGYTENCNSSGTGAYALEVTLDGAPLEAVVVADDIVP